MINYSADYEKDFTVNVSTLCHFKIIKQEPTDMTFVNKREEKILAHNSQI